VNITDVKTTDNKGAYDIPLLKGSVILADRFHNDFSLLNLWDSSVVFFVVRHKETIQYKTIKENKLPENKQQYILTYKIVELTGIHQKRKTKKG
ncbi:MAG: hypothetical protein ACI81S_002230, partial [Sphingobacteriales bacterium]